MGRNTFEYRLETVLNEFKVNYFFLHSHWIHLPDHILHWCYVCTCIFLILNRYYLCMHGMHFVQWIVVRAIQLSYGTCNKKLYKSRQIPWKFCAATCGIAVLLPRRVSPISAEWYFIVRGFVLTKLTPSFFVKCLYCIWIWRTSFALVASNNNGLITDT